MEKMADSGCTDFEDDTAITGYRVRSQKPSAVRPKTAPVKSAGTTSYHYVSKLNFQNLDEDDPPYPMTAEGGTFVGICVIFNVINFKREKKRQGSEKDGQAIRKIFRGFGFDVREMLDPTKAKMEQCLKTFAKNYQKEWKCFACFLLSHGDSDDVLLDTDSKHVRISELVHCMSAKACPQMAGKPKLFSYRGQEFQEGVPTSGFETDGKTQDSPIPAEELDMLVSFCTTPGYISFRCPREGSPYIQMLLQMLSRFGEKQDISSILRRTTKLVGKMDCRNGYKMCPCYFSTLCRPLIFSSHLESPEEDFTKRMEKLNISSS